MYPVLFKIWRLEIHSYGLMLAISFLAGVYWSMYRAQKRGIKKDDVMDVFLFVVISAIIGARLMYVLTHLSEFRVRWLDTFNPFPSTGGVGIEGLTMLGGVLLALVTIIIYCRIKKIALLRLWDVVAPAFGLGIFLTRIGCFLNGCCYGKPCDLPWGVVFPVVSPAGFAFQGVHIHPTQLYSSLYGLVIMIVILILDRKPRFDGFLSSVFFMLYGISRFGIDFFRYYEKSVQFSLFGLSLTFNQGISILMFLSGLVLFLKLHRSSRQIDEKS
jgi:phosphatidylglycerol:prolipoprotein diacylglycerol transferase